MTLTFNSYRPSEICYHQSTH